MSHLRKYCGTSDTNRTSSSYSVNWNLCTVLKAKTLGVIVGCDTWYFIRSDLLVHKAFSLLGMRVLM